MLWEYCECGWPCVAGFESSSRRHLAVGSRGVHRQPVHVQSAEYQLCTHSYPVWYPVAWPMTLSTETTTAHLRLGVNPSVVYKQPLQPRSLSTVHTTEKLCTCMPNRQVNLLRVASHLKIEDMGRSVLDSPRRYCACAPCVVRLVSDSTFIVVMQHCI